MKICLVMMMKNEAGSISALCQSARPAVDSWLLLDTGSSDKTIAIAQRELEGLPGKVAHAAFEDFATSRNLALDLAESLEPTFTLFLSGDETLIGADKLRAFAEAEQQAGWGAHHIQITMGSSQFFSARLARAASRWRYKGAVHEYLDGPGGMGRTVPGVSIRHDLEKRDQKRAAATFRDVHLPLLKAAHEKDPSDTRAVFYLAQTHDCLGDYARALELYDERARMGGWKEERYEALYRSGRVAVSAGKPWPEAAARYLDAHLFAPHRIEPLVALAEWYARRHEWPIAYLYARRAAELYPPTSGYLFLDAKAKEKALDLLGASAFYVGDFERGREAIDTLLAMRPGDERLIANLEHYKARR